jgi:uncharacterized protein YbjQ (UPF0145 family)
VGGERGQTRMLIDSRMQAQQRLVDEAMMRDANAILAMRFDATRRQRLAGDLRLRHRGQGPPL